MGGFKCGFEQSRIAHSLHLQLETLLTVIQYDSKEALKAKGHSELWVTTTTITKWTCSQEKVWLPC